LWKKMNLSLSITMDIQKSFFLLHRVIFPSFTCSIPPLWQFLSKSRTSIKKFWSTQSYRDCEKRKGDSHVEMSVNVSSSDSITSRPILEEKSPIIWHFLRQTDAKFCPRI
jgi:hypothetical protein